MDTKTEDAFECSEIHLGKSSCGWQFLFNHNYWKYYDYTQESIKTFMRSCEYSMDEYGNKISVEEFWDLVDKKKNGLTGKTYHEKEIQSAREAIEKSTEKYKSNLYRDLTIAYRMRDDAEMKDWYEEATYNMKPIPYSELNYRFNNSTEFS